MGWGAAKAMLEKMGNNTAIEALHLLEQNGMVKFDKLLNNAGIPLLDSGMLAVYDLILVTLANNFSACAKTGDTARAGVGRCSKSDKNICRSCNHLGKFAALA